MKASLLCVCICSVVMFIVCVSVWFLCMQWSVYCIVGVQSLVLQTWSYGSVCFYLSLVCVCVQGFGNSFLQSDITIFKQNLLALEALNTKHKLYSKVGGQ